MYRTEELDAGAARGPEDGARRRLCLALAGLAAGASAAGGAHAQNPAAGTMRIISPYPAGGGTDGFARALGQKFTERLGLPVVVENRGGANGTVGAAVAAKAPPDGRTLLLVAAGYATGASLYKDLPYDQDRDLAPVALLASGPLVLVVHPSLGVNSVQEFIALAKAHPGQINYASSGIGSLPHLAAEQFAAMSGIRLVHVPYKGPSVAMTDVQSGRVPAYFCAIYSSLPHIRSGKLRGLGVTTAERSPIAPDLPTIAESGLPGFDMTNWYGLLTPAGTPAPEIAKLNEIVNWALGAPELKQLADSSGMTIASGSAEQFGSFLHRESDKFTRLIRSIGLKADA
ncbi:tripartite tricarboxylate transporter substrate binding protein [Pigmentiphaga soli]|uniref:Tripartite tricarboxylate transporter substrate binding protein n=1 Tax=Pigmentiphaga soli TaxID=1007095 RepID=A0ABP8GRI0_9BURK